MKYFYLFTFILLSSGQLFAQSTTNLVFFSEQGERFYVILNGIQQNINAETNVRVTNLIQPYYKVKLRFADSKYPDIDKTINFNQGTETTYIIKNTGKGLVLRWMSEVPIQQAPPTVANQNVIIYHSEPVTQTTSVTQTTVTNTQPVQTEQINMGINVSDPMMGGTNATINVNVNATGTNTAVQSQSTTMTTTTTTTNSSTNVNPNNTLQTHSQPNTTVVYVMPGYTGSVGCNGYPMSDVRFNEVCNSISSKSFEDSKITLAKQVINTNCMTSAQVKKIMLLFSFEETKLDLAKYAYGYTYDISNYYQLNDAFTFESSIEELNEYIQNFKK